MIGAGDWTLLMAQIGALVILVGREAFRKERRNVFAALIGVALLTLVHGQALWVFGEVSEGRQGDFRHMFQVLSLEAILQANKYLAICTGLFVLSYFYFARRTDERKSVCAGYGRAATPTLLYPFVTVWTAAAVALLLTSAGGLVEAATRPGQNWRGGVTMLMVLVGMGKLVLLRKLASKEPVTWLDIGLLGVAFMATLLNSRFIAAFILLQIAIVTNYCRRALSRWAIGALTLSMLTIFIVFGLYRHYTSIPGAKLADAPKALETLAGSPIAWFYRLNIEGFTGLAGILTFQVRQGGSLEHDYGASTLRFISQLVPNKLRSEPTQPFFAFHDWVESRYPYKGSVIPSGIEIAYAHFGILGIAAFGAFLGWLVTWLHLGMSNPRADRLLIGLLSVHSLQLVRGTFYLALFFAISELAVLICFRVLFSATAPATRLRVQPGGGSG
jgi:hypothetical protein